MTREEQPVHVERLPRALLPRDGADDEDDDADDGQHAATPCLSRGGIGFVIERREFLARRDGCASCVLIGSCLRGRAASCRAGGRPARRTGVGAIVGPDVASGPAPCRRSRRARASGPRSNGTPVTFALQRAQVVHDVPAIALFDAVVRRHQAASVADHAEDVAVGAALGGVVLQRRSPGHAVLRRRPLPMPSALSP